MSSNICQIDDKHVPIYRILWISEVPHFCGDEDCTAEGRYEVRLEGDESVFGSQNERDDAISALHDWGRRILREDPDMDDNFGL